MTREVNPAECGFVETWLDDWVAGRASTDAARRIEHHIEACERCRRLAAIVRESDEGAGADDVDFVEGVLTRTSGSACARAEAMLPDFVDGELDANSRDMLQSHVSHCETCAGLLAVLQEARQTLPALAEVQPPLAFAERVLAVTSHAVQPSAFAEWWRRVLSRPRASLELAYVATVLLVVFLGNPVAAFHAAEEHAGALAAAVPVERLSGRLSAASAATGVIGRLFNDLNAAVSVVATELSERWRQAKALLDGVGTTVRDAVVWLAHLDLGQMLKGGGQSPGKTAEPAPRR